MGCDVAGKEIYGLLNISIHAARVGCDAKERKDMRNGFISIHAARVGCDKLKVKWLGNSVYFNPRSPSGLRHSGNSCECRLIDFNPRSPSGLRPELRRQARPAVIISIHAARVGCDVLFAALFSSFRIFQSTQPEWAATLKHMRWQRTRTFQSTQPEWAATFNRLWQDALVQPFQSTQPEWAATVVTQCVAGCYYISIHAARVGCDNRTKRRNTVRIYFNPRSPSGLRPRPLTAFILKIQYFNPRSPSGLRPSLQDKGTD